MAGVGVAGVAVLGTTACGSGSSGGSGGEEFPSDTIEMIIAYSAGGSTDVSVRSLASAAEDTCGTNVIASNQTGAGGATGFTAAANAEPNGYTVGATASELAFLYQYGTTEVRPDDFKGVMRYALNPHIFWVSAESPYETIDDVISAAEDGETINVSTSGTGGVYHLAFAGMALEAGVQDQFTNVPYDGGATAVQAAVAGETDMAVSVFQEGASQAESGRLRPIAVAGEERVEAIPDVPTLREQGIDWTSASHLGLAVPAETPDDQVQTLADCYKEAFDTEEFQQAMEEQNLTLSYMPPEEFDQYLRSLSDRYGRVIEEVGISASQG
jgi:tripartite-type tricarboxylate transporter receptor subunit TctC